MKFLFRRLSPRVCAAAVILASQPLLQSQTVLFSENFETDPSANWDVFNGSGNGTPDYTVLWTFDYSTNTFTRNGTTMTIPPAPGGSGSKGVKMWVNKNDDIPDIAAVSIYPKGKTFSGDFALKFDMWLNYNGPAYGGTGSTEFGTFGIDHTADKVNWQDGVSASDGVWFGVTGEGGAAYDYRAYASDGFSPAARLPHSVWLDRDGDGIPEDEIVGGSEPPTYPLNYIFPAPDYESEGMPGKHWVQVEIRQRTNTTGGHVVTLLMNNYVFAEHEYGDIVGMTSGDLMLGNMDIFSSIANPRQDNFVIYDNVRVVDLTGAATLPIVTVVTNDDSAAEPSDPGSYTITRFGDTTGPLTVNYRMTGTASNGVDYVKLPGSLTFAAGQSLTNVVLMPLNDTLPEPVETATLVLLGSTNYDIYTNIAATVSIADGSNLPGVSLKVIKSVAYEANPNNEARVEVDLLNPAQGSITVNFQLSGTAVAGTDYAALGNNIVIPAGETNAVLHIRPINNNVPNGADRTVEINLTSSPAYLLGGVTNATVYIRDDDFIPTGTLVYSENFDTDDSAKWTVNNSATDGPADLYFDYSTVGIPSAPNSTGGTTRGAKLQANLSSGIFGGVSISPTGLNITNEDYVLRFDLWQNFNGPAPGGGSGSTQITGGGIGTAGTTVQYPGSVDGIWFAATGDGGSSVDYRAYSKSVTSGYDDASSVFAAGKTGNPRSEANAYYADFGAESAPADQVAIYPSQTGVTAKGAQAFVWHDVVVAKQADTVKWYIDGKLIATVNGASTNMSGGDIVLLHSDINAGISADPNAQFVAFGLFDDVRVYALASAAAPIRISDIRVVNPNVELTFTAGQGDSATDFKVDAAAVATGPYNPATATTSLVNPGTFKAVLPTSGSQQFYRISR